MPLGLLVDTTSSSSSGQTKSITTPLPSERCRQPARCDVSANVSPSPTSHGIRRAAAVAAQPRMEVKATVPLHPPPTADLACLQRRCSRPKDCAQSGHPFLAGGFVCRPIAPRETPARSMPFSQRRQGNVTICRPSVDAGRSPPQPALPAPAPTAAHVASCQLSARLPRLVRLCAVQTLQTPRLEMQLPAAASPATKARTLGIPDRSLRSGNRARLLRLLGTHTDSVPFFDNARGECCTPVVHTFLTLSVEDQGIQPSMEDKNKGLSFIQLGLLFAFAGVGPALLGVCPKRPQCASPLAHRPPPPAALKPDALNR